MCLLLGAKKGRWWMFGIAGVFAGVGHMIRPESWQLMIYGVVWLAIVLVRPRSNMSRRQAVIAMLVLAAGFSAVSWPYLKAKRDVLPRKLQYLISFNERQATEVAACNVHCEASVFDGQIVRGVGKLVNRISENLMHFFVPAFFIGLYVWFRKGGCFSYEKFFIGFFILLNVAMMILLYRDYEYISRRHCMPIVVMGIFYVPVGLEAIAVWLDSLLGRKGTLKRGGVSTFAILVAVGLAVCVPKLFSPIGEGKGRYLVVAKWLRENTPDNSVIGLNDRRFGYYAVRKTVLVKKEDRDYPIDYYVKVVKNDEDDMIASNEKFRREYSVWVDREKMERVLAGKFGLALS